MDCPRSGALQFAHEQLDSVAAEDQLTASVYNGTVADSRAPFKACDALIQVLENDIYYTIDGSTPSASNGKVGAVGSFIGLSGYTAIKNFRFVRVSADGKLDVDYFR